jgi:transposase
MGMGNARGVHRDFDELERRRIEGARLLRKGVSQAEVARRVGVSRQSVNRWAEAMDRGGSEALRSTGFRGRRPGLSDQQIEQLEEILEKGPEAQGFVTSLWTLKRVGGVIEQTFGRRYSTSNVWCLLQRMRWSCQRPEGRARERDEEKIRDWKTKRWPALKRGRYAKGARSSSSTRAD